MEHIAHKCAATGGLQVVVKPQSGHCDWRCSVEGVHAIGRIVVGPTCLVGHAAPQFAACSGTERRSLGHAAPCRRALDFGVVHLYLLESLVVEGCLRSTEILHLSQQRMLEFKRLLLGVDLTRFRLGHHIFNLGSWCAQSKLRRNVLCWQRHQQCQCARQ